MSKKTIKFFRIQYGKIITFILGLMGFAAGCFPRVEYGSPYAKYTLKGDIKSSQTEQPIENIQVQINNNNETLSDTDGNFSISFNGYVYGDSISVSFIDIDSNENGEYEKLDTFVIFNDPPTGGDDAWNMGHTEETISIKLNEKPNKDK